MNPISIKLWKYFHKVAYIAPRLIFLVISKLDCVKSAFSNAIYKLFRGNCPRQKSVGICFGKNFMDGSCPGVVVLGELFRKKCPGSKSPGDNYSGRNFMGAAIGGKLSLRGNFIGDSCSEGGAIFQGQFSGGS